MKHAAKMLKVQASFSIVPDLVLVSVTNPRLAEPETVAVKSPQAMDVWRVSRVVRTMNNFYKGHFGPEECLASLKRILASKPTCSNIAVCLSFALTGFTATACMFEGTWIDASAAGAAGLVAALLFIAANNFPAYGPVYEVSCSILVGFFARALNRYACFTKVAVSSILILLPGYGMTMSVVSRLYTAVNLKCVKNNDFVPRRWKLLLGRLQLVLYDSHTQPFLHLCLPMDSRLAAACTLLLIRRLLMTDIADHRSHHGSLFCSFQWWAFPLAWATALLGINTLPKYVAPPLGSASFISSAK